MAYILFSSQDLYVGYSYMSMLVIWIPNLSCLFWFVNSPIFISDFVNVIVYVCNLLASTYSMTFYSMVCIGLNIKCGELGYLNRQFDWGGVILEF